MALKVLLPNLANNQEMVQRFMREAKAANRLRHPNIIHIEDVYEYDDIHFFAMDYVEGQTLRDYLASRGTLAEDECLHIGIQIARALSESHSHADRIIHRDIKPSNILLHHSGNVVVTDFGIAKVSEDSLVTSDGSILGTLRYASPEQTAGREIGPQTDLYSLGVVLYEMATGATPFQEAKMQALVWKNIHETPRSAIDRNPDLSQSYSDMVMRCLEKQAKDRFQSAEELIAVIQDISAGKQYRYSPAQSAQSGAGDVTEMADKSQYDQPRGQVKLIWTMVVISALLTAGGIWYFVSPRSSDKPVAVPAVTAAPSQEDQEKARLAEIEHQKEEARRRQEEAQRRQAEAERKKAEEAEKARQAKQFEEQRQKLLAAQKEQEEQNRILAEKRAQEEKARRLAAQKALEEQQRLEAQKKELEEQARQLAEENERLQKEREAIALKQLQESQQKEKASADQAVLKQVESLLAEGRGFEGNGDFERAKSSYVKALELDPNHTAARAAMSEWAGRKAIYEQQQELERQRAILAQQKKEEEERRRKAEQIKAELEAEKARQAALKKKKDLQDARNYINQSLTLAKTKQYDLAKGFMAMALLKAPDDDYVKQKVQQVQRLLKSR